MSTATQARAPVVTRARVYRGRSSNWPDVLSLRSLPTSPSTGLGSSPPWAAASLLAGSLLLHLRDA